MTSEFQEYYEAFRLKKPYTAKFERAMLRKIKAGDVAAKQEFIEHNMRLVLSCVLRFVKSTDPKAMDLVSAGTLGLIKAIDDFKISKTNRFSTYAVWWIKARIRKELGHIKPRIYQNKLMHAQYRAAAETLRSRIHRDPAQEEVFAELGWSKNAIEKFSAESERQIVPIESVITDADEGDVTDNALTLAADEAVLDPVYMAEDCARLHRALNQLTPVLEDIIRRHYGLDFVDTATYDELAAFYGFTRERVRQLENEGLRKLWLILNE